MGVDTGKQLHVVILKAEEDEEGRCPTSEDRVLGDL
jgi:hypothetical protein